MGVLFWDKPEKVMPTEEWVKLSAEGAPPGVYEPNMSEADMRRWKAKFIKNPTSKRCYDCEAPRSECKEDTEGTYCSWCRRRPYRVIGPRIEIRKTTANGTQIAIVVSDEGIKLSMNGKAQLTAEEAEEMHKAILEAQIIMRHPR